MTVQTRSSTCIARRTRSRWQVPAWTGAAKKLSSNAAAAVPVLEPSRGEGGGLSERPSSPSANLTPRISLSPALAMALGGARPEVQRAGSEVSSLRSSSPSMAGANNDLPEGGAVWDGALGPALADAPAPVDVVPGLSGGAAGGSPRSNGASDDSTVTVPLRVAPENRRTIEARHDAQRNARRTAMNVLRVAEHPCFTAEYYARYFYETLEEFQTTRIAELWGELDWWMRETISVNPDEGEEAAGELRRMEREMQKVKQGIDTAVKAAKEMASCGDQVASDTIDLYRRDNFASLRALPERFILGGDGVERALREEGIIDDEDERE